MLRIIAGERRGHKIEGPSDSRTTRPTSDMVRESIFNILGSAVEDLTVVDLFAGTGALGLEALSRGARLAVFVEKKRENAALILRNVATLRYEDRVRVDVANAYTWAESPAIEPGEPAIVLLDPPYRDYEDRPRKVRQLLEHLLAALAPGSLIVAESGRIDEQAVLPDLPRWDIRRYGDTRLAVYQVPEPDAPTPDAS